MLILAENLPVNQNQKTNSKPVSLGRLFLQGDALVVITVVAIGFAKYLFMFGFFPENIAFLDPGLENDAFITFVAGSPIFTVEFPAR